MSFPYRIRGMGSLFATWDCMHRQAIDALTEAMKFQERVLGPSHATILETLNMIAEASLVGADTSMALTYYKQVLG
eukprot:scaffold19_cov114-Cylindrotheca_fusiformis.AAC.36